MPPLPQAASAGAMASRAESPRTTLRRLKVTRAVPASADDIKTRVATYLSSEA